MKKKWLGSVTLLITTGMLITAGCATRAPDASDPSPRPLGKHIPTIGSESHPVSDTHTVQIEPTNELNLKTALSLALMKNHELKAFSWEVRAAEARVLQAGLLPNPELEAEVEEYDSEGTGFDTAETVIALGQLVEMGGKRRKRLAVAKLESDLTHWDYETKRLDVFVETTKAFIDILAAQRSVELATKAADLASKVHTTVSERVQSGKVTPLEGDRAKVELSLSKLALERSKNELQSARSRLSLMWGISTPSFTSATGQFDEVLDTLPSLKSLETEFTSNPDVARLQKEIELRKAELALERSAVIPDLSATAGIQQFEATGEDAMLFGVALVIPIFDRNQGNISAAKHEMKKGDEEALAILATAQSHLVNTYNTLRGAQLEAIALQQTILPSAERAFNAATDGYQQGKFEYLEVLDAQRTMLEVTEQYTESLSAYHKATAELERLIGRSLTDKQTKE
jgi:cobalt-zinc-cadmium efflux system outer membrane protein